MDDVRDRRDERDGTAAEATNARTYPDTALTYLVHELRTPLTVIRGFAEMLAESAGATERSFADAIVRNAYEISRRLELVDAASRGFDSTLPLRLEVCDLGEIVATLSTDMATDLAAHEVVLRNEGRLELLADPSRLSQAIGNLLSNAAKFSSPKTEIEVSVGGNASWATVRVADQGPGIPLQQQGMLFQPFSPLDPRRSGTGFGLFLVRRIADAHGGDIRYEPGRNTGSIFTLTIPRNLPHGDKSHHG